MEDTKSLVTIFLQKVFHDRQHIIDSTYKIIYDYNNGDRKKVDYEKTLKSICTQLGREIPNQVLVYLLTLVDMPLDLAESDDSQLKPVIEKIKTLEEIQKTQNCLADCMKPHLEHCVQGSSSSSIVDVDEPRIIVKPRKNRRKLIQPRYLLPSLLDMAANVVVKHHNKLKKIYQKKSDKTWQLINSNRYAGKELEQCYETLRCLNKKRKLLRDIETDNVTEEVVAGFYPDIDILLKEKHVYEIVNMDIDAAEKRFSTLFE